MDYPINGLILAGGQSSRMGFDKSQLNFHGELQVSWLNKLLLGFCNQVFVSGSPAKIPGQFTFIEDHYETGGPMNGILSAFRQFSSTAWLVLPVDMPHLNAEAISFLLQHRDPSKLATCFVMRERGIEPLPVILESSAHAILLKRFLQGEHSLNSFLKTEATNQVIVPHESWLTNINTPIQLNN